MAKSRTLSDHFLNFNIDAYLNPIIPPNPLAHLPKPISHFLGQRSNPQPEPPLLTQWLLTFFSTVAGLCLAAGVYNHAPGLSNLQPPVMIASLGASAVLDYNAIRSPLAQPRNAIFGHTFSAVIGVAISKAFQSAPEPFFENYSWVAGALACALASWIMSVTKTVHPPGGATAILACTSREVVESGWGFVPLVMIGSLLMLAVALLFNNTLRQYPVFWWTPEEVGGKLWRRGRSEDDGQGEMGKDGSEIEKQVSRTDRYGFHHPDSIISVAVTFLTAQQ